MDRFLGENLAQPFNNFPYQSQPVKKLESVPPRFFQISLNSLKFGRPFLKPAAIFGQGFDVSRASVYNI
jgi:hypothetical protein